MRVCLSVQDPMSTPSGYAPNADPTSLGASRSPILRRYLVRPRLVRTAQYNTTGVAMTAALSLDSYRLLGRSGLRVSPLALGTMTFGAVWGSEEGESRRIFDTYVDRGGNFIDTAGR